LYVPPTSHTVAQLCEALRYKPECHRFDFQWRHWDFSLTLFFRPHYGCGLDSACNWNEYQEYFLEGREGRCVGLTNLPPTSVDFLEIWEPEPPENIRTYLSRPIHGTLYDHFWHSRTLQVVLRVYLRACMVSEIKAFISHTELTE
jgi:hypothetical protein